MKTILLIQFSCAVLNTTPGSDGFVNSDTCYDMCAGKQSIKCFKPELCGSKTGAIDDYDYLLLDQLWVPQFCRDLSNGVDVTITFPKNSTCDGKIKNRLTIHGLWPNYFGGYMGCCTSPEVANVPLDPSILRKDSLFEELLEEWRLPVGNATNSLCFTWNHEWQKHGYCMAPAANPKDSERLYFKRTLSLNKRLREQSKQINAWGKLDSKVLRSEIEALYPKKVQLVCSKTEDGSKLSAVRTCWNREMAPIDCEDFKSCADEIWIAQAKKTIPKCKNHY